MGNFFNNEPHILKLMVRVRIYYILIYIYKKNWEFENWIFKKKHFETFIEVKLYIPHDHDGPTKIFWWLIVFNATCNKISVISWRSVLMVEEPEIPGENHRPVASN